MTQAPWLWLVAGPNGAGKTTYARSISSEVDEIVRPDLLAIELSAEDPDRVALQAGRLAIARIKSLLQQKRSFAVETTLSGKFHLDTAKKAKSAGWNVGIVYIGLTSPTVAIARVRLRKLGGGHNVPAADVRRRYRRSLVNLNECFWDCGQACSAGQLFFANADETVVGDKSRAGNFQATPSAKVAGPGVGSDTEASIEEVARRGGSPIPARYLLLIGASVHDCWVIMKGSAETLIWPRKGQSSAMIITITSASVAATTAVIAMCRPKLS